MPIRPFRSGTMQTPAERTPAAAPSSPKDRLLDQAESEHPTDAPVVMGSPLPWYRFSARRRAHQEVGMMLLQQCLASARPGDVLAQRRQALWRHDFGSAYRLLRTSQGGRLLRTAVEHKASLQLCTMGQMFHHSYHDETRRFRNGLSKTQWQVSHPLLCTGLDSKQYYDLIERRYETNCVAFGEVQLIGWERQAHLHGSTALLTSQGAFLADCVTVPRPKGKAFIRAIPWPTPLVGKNSMFEGELALPNNLWPPPSLSLIGANGTLYVGDHDSLRGVFSPGESGTWTDQAGDTRTGSFVHRPGSAGLCFEMWESIDQRRVLPLHNLGQSLALELQTLDASSDVAFKLEAAQRRLMAAGLPRIPD